MCVNIVWWASISNTFYSVAAELCEAAQLCVFILGTQYLYLGVLIPVFRVRYAVYVLVIDLHTACILVLVFQLDLDFYDDLEQMDLSDYIHSNTWRVVEAPAKKNVKYYACCQEPYPGGGKQPHFEF